MYTIIKLLVANMIANNHNRSGKMGNKKGPSPFSICFIKYVTIIKVTYVRNCNKKSLD